MRKKLLGLFLMMVMCSTMAMGQIKTKVLADDKTSVGKDANPIALSNELMLVFMDRMKTGNYDGAREVANDMIMGASKYNSDSKVEFKSFGSLVEKTFYEKVEILQANYEKKEELYVAAIEEVKSENAVLTARANVSDEELSVLKEKASQADILASKNTMLLSLVEMNNETNKTQQEYIKQLLDTVQALSSGSPANALGEEEKVEKTPNKVKVVRGNHPSSFESLEDKIKQHESELDSLAHRLQLAEYCAISKSDIVSHADFKKLVNAGVVESKKDIYEIDPTNQLVIDLLSNETLSVEDIISAYQVASEKDLDMSVTPGHKKKQ